MEEDNTGKEHAVFLELRKHDLFLFGRNLKRIERHIFHLWADIITLQSPLFKFYFQNGSKTRFFLLLLLLLFP